MFVDPSGNYNRQAAVDYANRYWLIPNLEYYYYETDCTNYVSQVIFAGGIEMNGNWHSYKKLNWLKCLLYPFKIPQLVFDWDINRTWSVAGAQFNYFSNPSNGYINGNIISIFSPNSIANAAENCGVQPGDLLYFVKDGKIHHAAVITKIADGKIYYNGHTSSRKEQDLSETMGNDAIYIVRIKDEA